MVGVGRIILVFLIVAAAAVALQLVLPGLVENRIEAGIVQSLDDVKLVRVEVRAIPAYALLVGRIPAISIDLRRVTMGDLTIDAVLLDGRNLVIDIPKLLSGEGVDVRSADSLRGTFVISEDDLNEYFWTKVQPSKFFRVALDRGRAVLQGQLNLLGKEMSVTVSGIFQVTDGTTVSFVPKDVTVAETAVPRLLMDVIAKEWGIALDLKQAAIPLIVEDLLVEDGQLLIYGRRPVNG